MAERLSGVDVFVAAVGAGGFCRCGERLHLTRSAVAKAIARIEERLDVRLFHRTTRRPASPRTGRPTRERRDPALEELRAGEAVGRRREPAGRSRVSAPVHLGRHCVAPVLAGCRATPCQELSFLSDRPVDLIEDGLDLAIRTGNIADGAGLMTRTMALQRMTICGAPNYLATAGPERLDDLAQHTGIAYGAPGKSEAGSFQPVTGKRSSRRRLPAASRFDDIEAVADAAEAGPGLAWVPDCWNRDQVRSATLIPLLSDVPSRIRHTVRDLAGDTASALARAVRHRCARRRAPRHD